MSEELRVYRTYGNFVKRFLLVGGICPSTGKRYIAYRYLSFWSMFSCFGSLLAIGYGCTKIIRNIHLLTLSLSTFATTLSIVTKGFCFSIYKKKLRLINDILDSLLEKLLDEIGLGSVAFFFLRTFYRLIYFEAVLMSMTASLHVTKSLLTRILDDSSTNTTKVQYSLPVHGVYPWSLDSSFIWYLHYLFESNACYFNVCISIGVDAFYGFCVLRVSAILRTLAVQLEMLSRRKDDDNHHRTMFRDCIRKHVLLFRCRGIIQQVYGPVILLVTATNAMCMCSLIFQLFQVNGMNVAKAGMFLVYFALKLIQTFMYAWPGDVIISESEFFYNKVYCSYWYENEDTNLVKQFSLILAQKPLTMKACHLIEVSLGLFVKILNTAISYYFLLETLDSDK